MKRDESTLTIVPWPELQPKDPPYTPLQLETIGKTLTPIVEEFERLSTLSWVEVMTSFDRDEQDRVIILGLLGSQEIRLMNSNFAEKFIKPEPDKRYYPN